LLRRYRWFIHFPHWFNVETVSRKPNGINVITSNITKFRNTHGNVLMSSLSFSLSLSLYIYMIWIFVFSRWLLERFFPSYRPTSDLSSKRTPSHWTLLAFKRMGPHQSYSKLKYYFDCDSDRLMSRPDTCIGIRIHLSTCGSMEHLIFILMYV